VFTTLAWCAASIKHNGLSTGVVRSISRLTKLLTVIDTWNVRYRQKRKPRARHDYLSQNLAAALQQLPLLRQLELSNSSFDDTALAAISSLTDLQALSVECLGRTSAAGYAALPASLTLLELKEMPHLAIVGSAANSLAALTQLQHLQLRRIRDWAPTAIGSLTQLTFLHLHRLQFIERARTDDQTMQQLLGVLAGLQQLRHLHFKCISLRDAEAEPAMRWAALVASTQLTYLCFKGVDWPPGDCVSNGCWPRAVRHRHRNAGWS
jgi:hypothetical protein